MGIKKLFRFTAMTAILICGLLLSILAVSSASAQTLTSIYVNSDWAGATGDPDGDGPASEMGVDAFSTIQDGVAAASAGATVYVSDGTLMAEGTVIISVKRANVAPTVSDTTLSYELFNGTPLSVAAPGVLEVASDADGDSLKPIIITGISHGTLTLRQDGSFEYKAAEGYVGTDSFTFKVTDGSWNLSS